MQAWKAHEHIDFNFTDCQLTDVIDSENEQYIKRLCRERIEMAGTFIQLIGADTRHKHKYVRWEAEIAIEKKCRIIGVNISGSRYCDDARTPPLIRNIGALFVPLSPRIIAYALEKYVQHSNDDYHYKPETYTSQGYPAA